VKSYRGENFTREWNEDPYAPELWDAMKIIRSDASAGFEALSYLAGQGSALAMMYLAGAYLRGQYGIQKDRTHGEHWLRRSANAGSIEGKYGLGWYYEENGKIEEAIDIYEKLIKLNFSPAGYTLGRLYFKGEKVQKDLNKSLYFLNKSRNLGHLRATNLICHIKINYSNNLFEKIYGYLIRFEMLFQWIFQAFKNPKSDRFKG